jgi:hypothetical protein
VVKPLVGAQRADGAAPVPPAKMLAQAMGEAVAANAAAHPDAKYGFAKSVPLDYPTTSEDVENRTDPNWSPTLSQRWDDFKMAAKNRVGSMADEFKRQLKGGS